MASSQQARLLERIQSLLPPFTEALGQEYRRMYFSPHDPKNALLARLQESGFIAQSAASDGPLLYLEHSGNSDRSLFFYSHCPGLFAGDAPIPTTVCGSVDGRFYAPGIAGTRATILAWLAGLDLYQQEFGSLPVTIKWLFDGGSSTESRHLKEFLAQFGERLRADFCLCSGGSFAEDGSPQLALGVKGRLGIELTARTAPHTLDLQHGTIVPNAMWRLTWALASLKDSQEEVLIEGFYDDLILTGASEIEMLYALSDDAQTRARHLGLDKLLLGLRGFQQHYAHYLLPTCTITSLGGESTGIGIPSHAGATLDFYLVPGQQPETLYRQVQQHLLNQGLGDIGLRLLYGLPPAYTGSNDSVIQQISHVLGTASEHTLQLLPLSSESLPVASLVELLKCPFVIIGTDYPGSQRDSALEHLRLQDFETAIVQIALMLNMFEGSIHGPDGTDTAKRSNLGDPGRS